MRTDTHINLIENIQENFDVSQSVNSDIFSVHGMNILCMNINSIRNKKIDLELYIDGLSSTVHIVCITEIRLHSQECKFFNLKSYEAWFNCRACPYGDNCNDLLKCRHIGGGVAMYVHESVAPSCYEVLNEYKHFTNVIMVHLKRQNVKLCVVYRSQKSTHSLFFTYIESLMVLIVFL